MKLNFPAHSSTGERYDTILNSWVAIAPLNTPRRSLALGVLGGPMYALGGYDGASSLKSVERYDPQSNCWTKVIQIYLPGFRNHNVQIKFPNIFSRISNRYHDLVRTFYLIVLVVTS